MKIVINTRFGGFGLSYKGMMRYAELSGVPLYAFIEAGDGDGNRTVGKFIPYTPQTKIDFFCIHYATKPLKDGDYEEDSYFSEYEIERNDPHLIKVVEELGKESFGRCAKLKVVEIPDGIDWHIEEYDGSEHIAEKHRTWR